MKFISILQELKLINSADIFNLVSFDLDNFHSGRLEIQTRFIPNTLKTDKNIRLKLGIVYTLDVT